MSMLIFLFIFIFQELSSVNELCTGTRWPFPTLCSKTASTTEYVYVSNHARRLVDHSLCCARGLSEPPSMFTFPTVLRDSSITPYAVLKDCSDHSLITAWGMLFSITYELDSYTTEGQFNFLDLTIRLILCLPTSSGTTLVRCTWRCILVLEFLRGLFFLHPGTTCLYHLLPGSETRWAHFTLRWIYLLFQILYFYEK